MHRAPRRRLIITAKELIGCRRSDLVPGDASRVAPGEFLAQPREARGIRYAPGSICARPRHRNPVVSVSSAALSKGRRNPCAFGRRSGRVFGIPILRCRLRRAAGRSGNRYLTIERTKHVLARGHEASQIAPQGRRGIARIAGCPALERAPADTEILRQRGLPVGAVKPLADASEEVSVQ